MNDGRRVYSLRSEGDRPWAQSAVARAPLGFVVIVQPKTRSLDQNSLMHDLLTDISRQFKWHGKRLSPDVWKRLCMASWLRERGGTPELIPALDGNGFDVIYERTSKLNVQECSEFMEWIIAFGRQNDVQFRKIP